VVLFILLFVQADKFIVTFEFSYWVTECLFV